MRDLNCTGIKPLQDGQLYHDPGFIPGEMADMLLNRLIEEVPWQQDNIRIFGKTYQQPRLTALYAENERSYTYSGITMNPLPFPSILQPVKEAVEKRADHKFTTCLLNLYRDGNDSNGWHADNEKELGSNPVIASLSLGATRAFHLKHLEDKSLRYRLFLEHGSLLIMGGAMQHHWLHQIPKTRKPVGRRINLTFRSIQ
ncbi:MAG: alpha-ketoglutarate-dependent dioxygenase AlkB [Robiginitalea sp.]|jgi:alkylated DNA repair dioxygenase AlkB